MDTLATTPDMDFGFGLTQMWWHEIVSLTSSRPTEFLDITDRLQALVGRRIATGIVNVQTLHTTTALVINEHEPELLADFEATLTRTAPAGGYRHDDPVTRTANLTADERINGHAHCRALMLCPSVCLNVVDGRLLLGRWQRVFFVELDGPQQRRFSALVLGRSRGPAWGDAR